MHIPDYMIGSGFHGHPGDGRAEFFPLWLSNTKRYASPVKILVLSDSDSNLPPDNGFESVRMQGDLGFCGSLLSGEKDHQFAGGPAVLMALAALAYVNETDLIYKEQDCLWVGDVVGRMYREIGNGGIIFGAQKGMPCENCLFLMRHWFIPEFLTTYASSARETRPENICEAKFAGWAKTKTAWRYHSIPGGRDRPLPDTAEWYAQKFTAEELARHRDKF